jgi:sterol desaturase/sphingolipid hydroxylase (fatty acid hydroxylase superfamily)
MKKVEIVTTVILLTSALIFILLERRIPYKKGIRFFREGFWLDLVWYTLIQSFFLKIIIFDWIVLPLDKTLNLSQYHIVTYWPVALQVLFFLVTHDLYIYWFHRWQHNSKILWRTHEAHHSNKEIDWLAGSRSHSVEILINQTIEFAPIILLGANPIVVPIKALIDAVWGMYIHSNINVRTGWLQHIINGPEMHQWHHADSHSVFYSNFSTKFALWDWLFGTAYLPDKKPDEFGLYYDYPKDYFIQHAYMFKRIDEKKLLQNKFYKNYSELRPRFIKWITGKLRTLRGEPETPKIEQITFYKDK